MTVERLIEQLQALPQTGLEVTALIWIGNELEQVAVTQAALFSTERETTCVLRIASSR
jgi:hypothetical protein